MIEKLISLLLLIVGIIHLLPLVGVLSGERLTALYGVTLDDPNLLILMRHRALLFGLLGAFVIYAAFAPALQWLALVAAWLSVLGFVLLAFATGDYNPWVAKVLRVDLGLLVLLLVLTLLMAFGRRSSAS